ncbi:hypothetical protein V6N12_043716 [Hibiscus sabdariffa]|uniref:Uncharacterized protein n=1 Tax=Hibiscus sabdariffa TaxID=183260 RepID=A0ABR2DF45_9ROSI
MGGGQTHSDPPEKEEEEEEEQQLQSALSAVSGVRLRDAPIHLLFYFHTAIRAELAELRRLAVAAAEDGKSGSYSREFAAELLRRFEFLKLVCKYHSAAEDEVVFLALDAHIRNVACTYSLEHESIDHNFDSVFHCLNELEGSENTSKSLQELVFCVGTAQSSICNHMLKEEKQVFPLLVKQFSFQEQASLVWQFLGSIPVILLQNFLPWMISFFPPEEQEEIKNFVKDVVPKEKPLQEVVVSWLDKKHQEVFDFHTELAKGVEPLDGSIFIKSKPKFLLIKKPLGWMKAHCFQTNIENNPIDCLLPWQGAIQRDLKEILAELYQIKESSCFQNLDFIILRLKFLADVLILYSNALEKLFYPVLVDVSDIQLSQPTLAIQDLYIVSHIEHLLYLLHRDNEKRIPENEFVGKLSEKLESLVMNIGKTFRLQENEVFSVISKNCSTEMQQQLLCLSLQVVPLGLLKCVITWFASHLSEDESRSILQITKQGNSLTDKSFASLLLEWFHIGYSGKSSVENFKRDLEKLFSSRCSFLPVSIEEDAESCSFLSDMSLGKGSKSKLIKPVFVIKGKKDFPFSSASSHGIKHMETSYCCAINLHIFFPKMTKDLYSSSDFSVKKNCVDYAIAEPVPLDLIFFFHKALKKDLDYLVLGSALLAENAGFLPEFRQRFHLIHFLYQIHSDAEDEIAFPALEAKGKHRNISHSYSLDHKIEAEIFSKISLILDEVYELQHLYSSGEPITLDRVVKRQKLCIDLQDACKSMHKLLSDHVHREEVELWPLFGECFTLKEQERIIGSMLGRTGAEILQDMIPWLMASLTPDEQQTVMSLWHNATRNTMFDEWLGEWWKGHKIAKETEKSTIPSRSADPLEIISTYFPEVLDKQEGICDNFLRTNSNGAEIELLIDDKGKACCKGGENCSECSGLFSGSSDKRLNEAADLMGRTNEPDQKFQVTQHTGQCKKLETMSQDDLEAAIRRVSSDTSLDPKRKSYVMQNLLMSRWILKQRMSNMEINKSNNGDGIPGQHPSYRDPLELALGCKHYKRNCKLFAPCCNQLHTCIHCHNEVADHKLDRKSVTKMMCMKCLVIQSIALTCSTVSCHNLSMGKYYCKICKLFDDERQIYHCPYCNLCRVGKGLGVDYFHCMNCNACMSRSLSVHTCREKSFEDNCPICHEDFFSSTAPVKALPCGHMMHSACFQDYTCMHYTCPICSKSLGDMQVYFKMLDAFLAEEKIPDDYHDRTQVILCNDCEKKGTAPFHWKYHKCSNCGSYNTRVL